MLEKLRGVIAPFTTPFAEDDSVDLGAVTAQVDWLIAEGVHGLAAGGSTGEGHALTREEHRDLLAETVRATDGRVPVVAGIIANSTGETAARGRQVADLGADPGAGSGAGSGLWRCRSRRRAICSGRTTTPWSSISGASTASAGCRS